MTTTMTRENEWLAKARAIEPVTKAKRDQGETDRHLPQATYEAMRDAGLYKLMLPKVYGGLDADLESGLLPGVALADASLESSVRSWAQRPYP